ncbi:uncharacterized protein FOMMEDRAFT_152515 [Fomitiporia mediterranea MF3/22]|uniref:uncharacterized protein n=1 Tax=Fomitiporia mediterranea (strain MF3/22) TaxID=694068 RepID=UPI0004409474|nr:uncharacterized protein FOMMEDRAFT_152515 [Fomitiporia mediterranea MF3/22]EJD07153.1 hypothetical protein FOMMEDRAFT_152515 [Fomitiporia mediterranea MF3/22]
MSEKPKEHTGYAIQIQVQDWSNDFGVCPLVNLDKPPKGRSGHRRFCNPDLSNPNDLVKEGRAMVVEMKTTGDPNKLQCKLYVRVHSGNAGSKSNPQVKNTYETYTASVSLPGQMGGDWSSKREYVPDSGNVAYKKTIELKCSRSGRKACICDNHDNTHVVATPS